MTSFDVFPFRHDVVPEMRVLYSQQDAPYGATEEEARACVGWATGVVKEMRPHLLDGDGEEWEIFERWLEEGAAPATAGAAKKQADKAQAVRLGEGGGGAFDGVYLPKPPTEALAAAAMLERGEWGIAAATAAGAVTSGWHKAARKGADKRRLCAIVLEYSTLPPLGKEYFAAERRKAGDRRRQAVEIAINDSLRQHKAVGGSFPAFAVSRGGRVYLIPATSPQKMWGCEVLRYFAGEDEER